MRGHDAAPSEVAHTGAPCHTASYLCTQPTTRVHHFCLTRIAFQRVVYFPHQQCNQFDKRGTNQNNDKPHRCGWTRQVKAIDCIKIVQCKELPRPRRTIGRKYGSRMDNMCVCVSGSQKSVGGRECRGSLKRSLVALESVIYKQRGIQRP